MRVGGASDGLRDSSCIEQSPDFRAARSAIRTGSRGHTDVADGATTVGDGGSDLTLPHVEARADDGPLVRADISGSSTQDAEPI
jgi:hypothetical protein